VLMLGMGALSPSVAPTNRNINNHLSIFVVYPTDQGLPDITNKDHTYFRGNGNQ